MTKTTQPAAAGMFQNIPLRCIVPDPNQPITQTDKV